MYIQFLDRRSTPIFIVRQFRGTLIPIRRAIRSEHKIQRGNESTAVV
ncbi:hypothetical protein V1477_000014 [Vespula maculifrons]|uniref:Uncharacterized protein n=1 Tax=Vespula maculifrons TaxID=7453 RepID=A0ABD2D2T9_VESMC